MSIRRIPRELLQIVGIRSLQEQLLHLNGGSFFSSVYQILAGNKPCHPLESHLFREYLITEMQLFLFH